METSEVGVLTEEHFREWLREAFTGRGLANSGGYFSATTALEQEKQKLSTQLVAQQRAKKLLRRFITPVQWQDYNSLGYFSQKDGKSRTWKFKKGHHYPIECDGQPICIDPEQGAPDEDLLLQIWLEVIGGRGQELLPSGETYLFHYWDVGEIVLPERHGILCGIT